MKVNFFEDARWYAKWVGEGHTILRVTVSDKMIYEAGDDVGHAFYHE